jgi:DNA-binding PadR family transcriptional regulator
MSQDLSQAFGVPAASLRGLLPPRSGGDRPSEPPAPREPLDDALDDALDDDEFEDELDEEPEDDELDVEPEDVEPEEPEAPAAARHPARPPTAPRRAAAPSRRRASSGTNRRWGRARVTSREHADLLVLLSLRAGPADGRGVIARLRETSGGRLDAPEHTIYVTLHRLTRNRLLGRVPDPASGRRFYALTRAGERAAAARLREWHALTRCIDAVARAGD